MSQANIKNIGTKKMSQIARFVHVVEVLEICAAIGKDNSVCNDMHRNNCCGGCHGRLVSWKSSVALA